MNQVMQKGTFWSGKINELLSSLPCWHPVAVLEIHFEIGQKFFVSEKKKKSRNMVSLYLQLYEYKSPAYKNPQWETWLIV